MLFGEIAIIMLINRIKIRKFFIVLFMRTDLKSKNGAKTKPESIGLGFVFRKYNSNFYAIRIKSDALGLL